MSDEVNNEANGDAAGEPTPVEVAPQNVTDRIEKINIEEEMQRAYIDYSMSVIVGRALPDARDGLKPGNRRILFAMREGGYTHSRPYIKCARVVGDVIGKYHPHGDSAVYDTLVRMAQDFSTRYLLINGLTTPAKELEWTHVIIAKKGMGYGHEAMKLLKAWGFDDLKFHRAWLDCKDYNARALHLYESEGMQREGLIRETILTNGVYENLVILGILDREYQERKAKGLEL